MRAGCGLAVRRNASDRTQSVRGWNACAHTFKLSCRCAASPQVDPVGSAFMHRTQLGVISAMTQAEARDAAATKATTARIWQAGNAPLSVGG